MTVLGRLALLFIVVPVLELVLLIQLGQVIGLWPTLGLVLFTGLTGAALARLEGLRVLYQFQSELAGGSFRGRLCWTASRSSSGSVPPHAGDLDRSHGLRAAVPPSRRWIQRRLRRRLERGLQEGTIRVVSMGGAGFGWGGGAPGSAGPGGPGEPPGAAGLSGTDAPTGRREAEPPLDPSKGIVVEPKER